MSTDTDEEVKFELAAKKLVEIVGDTVGHMLLVTQVFLYGKTLQNRQKIYKTLEGYGYYWRDGRWKLEIPDWINGLVAESWYHHEITRD